MGGPAEKERKSGGIVAVFAQSAGGAGYRRFKFRAGLIEGKGNEFLFIFPIATHSHLLNRLLQLNRNKENP
ncbi:hypothetical protein FHW96_002790 [Novosphingobium sp. SG751A]|uniref:hypothetical protein n=1 Tax=Novosphingobium sp. SG751A TaxID=2587000 RepID=UPI0015517308|nr:hypothetical protein [Novosphingobium sp. SG751A]NOW46630.1 hypothetical protein [Novosphingobium sp. SG751A]